MRKGKRALLASASFPQLSPSLGLFSIRCHLDVSDQLRPIAQHVDQHLRSPGKKHELCVM